MPCREWRSRRPLSGYRSRLAMLLRFQIVGDPVDKDRQNGSRWMSVSPGYLDVFKIPILRGRAFNEGDTASAPAVALINQTIAERYWSGQNPIGHQIAISKGGGPGLDESIHTIVGVVGDTHNAGLGRPPGNLVIVPISRSPTPTPAPTPTANRFFGWFAPIATHARPSLPSQSGSGFPAAAFRSRASAPWTRSWELRRPAKTSTCCC